MRPVAPQKILGLAPALEVHGLGTLAGLSRLRFGGLLNEPVHRRKVGNVMTHRVRNVTAADLRLGDVVIPDRGPRRRVTLRRLEGAHPVVVVQFEGIPGASTYYPPSMPLLIEEAEQPPGSTPEGD